MKKYFKYKESKIDWIGSIPNSWTIRRLKNVATCNDEVLGENTNPEFDIEYVEISSVDPLAGITHKDKFKFSNAPSRARRQVKVNDILISTVRTYLRAIVKITEIDKNCIVSTGFAVVRPKNVNPNFLSLLVQSENFISRVISDSKGVSYPSITSEDLMNIEIPVPSQKEQVQISSYLISKIEFINTVISKKHQLISLLQEERTALINQAVTKGLDPNVKMKPSGIEWLGDVPEDWNKTKLKYSLKINGRIGFRGYTNEDFVEEGKGAIALSPGNIKSNLLDLGEKVFISKAKYLESPEIMIFPNDVVFVKTGSTFGKVAVVPNTEFEITLNPQMVVFKELKLNPTFLYYLLQSEYIKSQLALGVIGGAAPTISQEKLNALKICLPNTDEQLAISNQITIKTSEIDSILKKIENEILLLLEYKTSLINEVVTGKICVLPDEKHADLIKA
jgi:type I restriction enzyme S subunit